LAAVFSAFGLGFSDIAQRYEIALDGNAPLETKKAALRDRARRGMHAEGFALESCKLEYRVQITGPGRDESVPAGDTPLPQRAGEHAALVLEVTKAIARPQLTGRFGAAAVAAAQASTRSVMVDGQRRALPLFRAEDQPVGSQAAGPAVLEEAFFTCLVDAGWRFEVNDNADVLLTRQ
jgi:N-methylhydantoinase A/oxoprolinase/acetone carboxylase beta subunit